MTYIKAKDRIGTTVNGFKILDTKRENRRTYLYIICPHCKNKKWMRIESVTNGKNVSCGCYNAEYNIKKPVDITGQIFERLKAIKPTEQRDKNNGSIIWECECSCGKITYASEGDLVKGAVRSCGCFAAETSSNNGKIAGKNVAENFCVEGTNVKNLTAKIPKNNTSGIKGVTWDSARNKWRAQICFKGKNYHLGRYFEKKDAVAARKDAEKNIFGDFLTWYSETYPEKWDKMQKNNK